MSTPPNPFAPPESEPERIGSRPARFVVHDLPRPLLFAGIASVAVAWLAGRVATSSALVGAAFLGDVCAGMVLVVAAVVVAHGWPRTIEIDDREVRVYRRGLLDLRRPLDRVVGLHQGWSGVRLVFDDGTGMRWVPSGAWEPATHYVLSLRPKSSTFDPATGTLSQHYSTLRFPPACIGCGQVDGRQGTLVARGSAFVRNLNVPICTPCGRRAWAYHILLYWGGFALLGASLALVMSVKMPNEVSLPLVFVSMFAALLGPMAATRMTDRLALGATCTLSTDGATVVLKLRDPARTRAVADASG